MSQKRGAPFDIDNIFNRPAVDGGVFKSIYETKISTIQGTTFTRLPNFYVDGGSFPKAGSASYNPNIVYDSNSQNLLLGNDDGRE